MTHTTDTTDFCPCQLVTDLLQTCRLYCGLFADLLQTCYLSCKLVTGKLPTCYTLATEKLV